MKLPHIPVLRFGDPYESLDTLSVKDHRNGEVLAKISQANPGLIRRDLIKLSKSRNFLQDLPHKKLLEIFKKAAELFTNENLPLGIGNQTQRPEEYIRVLSATSGLPFSLCKQNMEKVNKVLKEMSGILVGLTRNLNFEIFDRRIINESGLDLSYYPLTKMLGVILPSNSPGVNSLWLPAIALKIPVVIKPGSEEPWTPWRIIQALIAAGCSREAFCFYPTTHGGSEAILDCCDRAMLFGDCRTVERFANQPNINVHGPGYSKIVIGEDEIAQWSEIMDVLVKSVAANSGRSCINVSTIIVPSHGEAIAEALSHELIKIHPRTLDDEYAELSAFSNPVVAQSIDAAIDAGLDHPGAADLTIKLRKTPRLIMVDGSSFLHPTVIYCNDFKHPLVCREYLFPFVTVVELPQKEIIDRIGPSLVVTAITKDKSFIDQLLFSPYIKRLNIGRIPTTHVQWNQPHEGNLFEFLYQRRAIQV